MLPPIVNRTAPVAHVLWAVYRLCRYILGAPAAIPRFAKQNTHICNGHLAPGIYGFLAGPRLVHGIQEKNQPTISNT